MESVIMILIFLCLMMISILTYARVIEPNKLIIKNYKIKAKDVNPLKIIFFSDTHFGKLYNSKNIVKIREKINKECPDIVIFGGDFFDSFIRDKEIIDFNLINDELNKINATYKFAVFGNHDISSGTVRIYHSFMEKSGFKVLENKQQLIQKFNLQIIGYDDSLLGYTKKELYDIKDDVFSIIVNHEPDIVDQIKTRKEAIMFSGHTHGGQVRLPIITKFVLPTLGSKYVYGKYSNIGEKNNISLFVSKGIGMSAFAFRLFCVPEIVCVEINAKVMN